MDHGDILYEEKIHTQFYKHFIDLNQKSCNKTLYLEMKQEDYHLNLTLKYMS